MNAGSNVNASVIIAAGGKSERLGKNKSKLFLEIHGKPLLFYSLDKFAKVKHICEVLIVTNDIKGTSKLLKKYKTKLRIKLVLGGSLRQESVFNGFKVLDSNTDVVIIHDVARPFFNENKLHEAIVKARLGDCFIYATPLVDTIKKIRVKKSGTKNINTVDQTMSRENIFQVQTPQIFSYQLLDEAYKKLGFYTGKIKKSYTDEASLIEELKTKLNIDIVIVESSRINFKITYKEDLEMAIKLSGK